MDEDGDRKAFLSRIGTFFLLLGALVVILFIASDMGKQTYFRYFFIGAILFVTGIIFKRMSAPPPSESKRFEALRKMQQNRREARAKKEAAKDKSRNRS